MMTLMELRETKPVIEIDDVHAAAAMLDDTWNAYEHTRVLVLARWAARLRQHYVEIGKSVAGDSGKTEKEATMDFGNAIKALKEGLRVARSGWNGKGMWLELQRPDANSKMGQPYVYMKGVDDKLFPWNPNQLDMLAEDWGLVLPS